MKLVFFGPPGSGKGTQADLLANKLDIQHLSTGDILRKKLKNKDEQSLQLQKILSTGNLVPDEHLNQIITEQILSKESANGFILDGYPRTMGQADFLISLMNDNNLAFDAIFNFNIDFKIVEQRIIDRYDQEKRTDDNQLVIKTRINKYESETYPVSEYFSKRFSSNYFTIDASLEILEIQKELIKILKKGEN